MCTIVVLTRPGHAWPVVIAANRDEKLARPWDPPGRWWTDQSVVGGLDRESGGTWMAMRDNRLAAVLNRPGTLGPMQGKDSRGQIPLIALAQGLQDIDAGQYRPFNVVLASARGAHFARGLGQGRVTGHALPPGVSMITAHDPNDRASPRAATHLAAFQAAPAPDPETGDWRAWLALMSTRDGGPAAINVRPSAGFGTVCASLIAIPAVGTPVWLFAAGPPDQAIFSRVALGG